MRSERRIVAVTGAAGFIGRNLAVRLEELGCDVRRITRATTWQETQAALAAADAVFHLAGAVRPADPVEFRRRSPTTSPRRSPRAAGARWWSAAPRAGRARTPASAVPCGPARRPCCGSASTARRSWPSTGCRTCSANGRGPTTNSCVATFCHNLARGLPIRIDDPAAPLSLLYVDDLIEQWRALMDRPPRASGYLEAGQVYETTVGALAATLKAFADGRRSGRIENVGSGLQRALYRPLRGRPAGGGLQLPPGRPYRPARPVRGGAEDPRRWPGSRC